MARAVYTLEEVQAMLQVTGAPKPVIERFSKQASMVTAHRREQEASAGETDEDRIMVGSGFGTKTGRGTVEFTLNDQRTQFDAKKAREVALMLLQAAEAATSDEMFVTLLKTKLGVDATEVIGRILLDLREIRQGTRGTAWPLA